MAEEAGAAVATGIQTEPTKTLVFNAPYSARQKANLRLTNATTRTIYWQVKSTKVKCYIPNPTGGVLKPNEVFVMNVFCEPMPAPPTNDRLSIEYTDAPDGATKLDRMAFEGAASVMRRVLAILGNE